VADGFRSGAAQFLSGLNVAVIREAFLPKDKSEPLSEVSARILCAVLWEKHSTDALELAGELLIRGVVGGRGGGGRSGRSQSLRCRRIFSMTEVSSMKLLMRNGPAHLGRTSGSADQTLRIKGAQARLQWRRKSSCSASGKEPAAGVRAAVLGRGDPDSDSRISVPPQSWMTSDPACPPPPPRAQTPKEGRDTLRRIADDVEKNLNPSAALKAGMTATVAEPDQLNYAEPHVDRISRVHCCET